MSSSSAVTQHDDQDLLSAAFEGMTHGVCVMDEAGIFIRANTAFCRMLGYACDDLLGRSWAMFDAPQEPAGAARILSALRAEAAGAPAHWRLRRKDGSLIGVQADFKLIALENGTRRMMASLSALPLESDAAQLRSQHSADFYRNVVRTSVKPSSWRRAIGSFSATRALAN
jgi:PAS domain S-box-containing protein